MAFTHTTFAQAVTNVARRLYDATEQQWTSTEIGDNVTEALRTWNALSQYWRGEMSFNLALDTWWYDLRAVGGSLIAPSVTEYQILTKIERHLLEPPTPASWTGSTQFTMDDLLQACRRRQDETLGVTACSIVQANVTAPLSRRTTLPTNTIDIRRVAWLPDDTTTYSNKVLVESDAWAARAFSPGYLGGSPTPPSRWMQSTQPPPAFDVDSVPPGTGNYDVLRTTGGPDWAQGTDATLTMPDDWTWVFTFGALADLFSRESLSQDPLRAAYCRARYNEGLGMMRLLPVLLALQVAGNPFSVGAVTGADRFNPGWQAAAHGAPKSAYTFMNQLAIAPKPDGTYAALATVCPNIDVANTYLQVPEDQVDTIVDYAQHLCMLKQGGQEFYQSINLYQNLQRQCAQWNSKLKEMGLFEMDQLDLSVLEEKSRNPRFVKGTEPQALA